MGEIKVEPTPEKNRRINPNILRGVILIIGLVVLWFMFGGSSDDSKKRGDANKDTVSTQKEDTFSNLKSYENTDPSINSNSKPNQEEQSQSIQNTASNNHSYSNQNYDYYQPTYSVDPAQETAVEQQRAILQKKQEVKEMEIKSGQRSPIFFQLPIDKEKTDQVKKTEPAQNKYYNDGYIEIIGEEGKR